MRENLDLHTGPNCVEQCGGRVLLHGRGDHHGQGRADGCSRDWIAVEFKRTDQFVHSLERGQVVCFTKRLGWHETLRDSKVVVSGGSVVPETGGQQGAWEGESSGSLDEIFGPPDQIISKHLKALSISLALFCFFFEIASGRELTLRPRRGVSGMSVDLTEAGDLEDSKTTSGEYCAYLEVTHLFLDVQEANFDFTQFDGI